MTKLTRLLNEVVAKWKHLKKTHQVVLVTSLEKAIWNWLDTYPDEFKDLQKRPNAELSTNCEKLFEHLDQFYEKNSDTKFSVLTIVSSYTIIQLSPHSRVRSNLDNCNRRY